MAMMQNQYVRSDFFTRNLSSQLLHLKGFINFMNWFNMPVQMFFWRKILHRNHYTWMFSFFHANSEIVFEKSLLQFWSPFNSFRQLVLSWATPKIFWPQVYRGGVCGGRRRKMWPPKMDMEHLVNECHSEYLSFWTHS